MIRSVGVEQFQKTHIFEDLLFSEQNGGNYAEFFQDIEVKGFSV